jgi:hypothetical protein
MDTNKMTSNRENYFILLRANPETPISGNPCTKSENG